MNEHLAPAGSAPADASAQPTAGKMLRQARESTGMHIAALAVAMKVPVKKLEALEADRLGDLPDAVFVRALAASMCRALKIAPGPVLERLPLSEAPRLGLQGHGINARVPTRSARAGQAWVAMLAKPTTLWVVVLLLAALLVLFFPDVHTSVRSADTGAAPVAMSPALAVSPTEAHAPAVREPETPLASASQPQLAQGRTEVVAAPAVPTVQATPIAALAPASAAVPLATMADGLVAFRARARAWVRVTDTKGGVVFEKTLAAGETGAANGVLPLSVVVGNVGATEVTVRGQVFTLDEFNKNNVARFEVK